MSCSWSRHEKIREESTVFRIRNHLCHDLARQTRRKLLLFSERSQIENERMLSSTKAGYQSYGVAYVSTKKKNYVQDRKLQLRCGLMCFSIRRLQSELIFKSYRPSTSSSSASYIVLVGHPLAFGKYTKGLGDHDFDGRKMEDSRRRKHFVAALHAVWELRKSAVGLNRKTE